MNDGPNLHSSFLSCLARYGTTSWSLPTTQSYVSPAQYNPRLHTISMPLSIKDKTAPLDSNTLLLTPSGVYLRKGTQTPRSMSSCSRALLLPLPLLLSCKAFALTCSNFDDGFLTGTWVLIFVLKGRDFVVEVNRGEGRKVERERDELWVQFREMNSMESNQNQKQSYDLRGFWRAKFQDWVNGFRDRIITQLLHEDGMSMRRFKVSWNEWWVTNHGTSAQL